MSKAGPKWGSSASRLASSAILAAASWLVSGRIISDWGGGSGGIGGFGCVCGKHIASWGGVFGGIGAFR